MRVQDEASLARAAYNHVRQRIVRGDLPVGQVISRRQVASELGMSFLPVSEALQRLEVEGLLESRPRAGTRVRIPTRRDVVGHYAVREALEVQSARLFAEVAGPQERRELLRFAARVDQLQTQSSRAVYLTAHEKLHRRIAEYANCPALTEALEKTHALASTWMCTSHPLGGAPSTRHLELAQVLAAGDADRAGAAMRRHIETSRQAALERLQPYFKMHRKRGKTFARGDQSTAVESFLESS